MSVRELTLGLRARRWSDTELFARAIEQDSAAFSELYRRHHTRIYGFCLARLLDPQAAEDATQETFLRVCRAVEAPDNVTAWLFTVARRVAIDFVRARSRVAEPVDLAGEALMLGASAPADAVSMSRADARDIFLALRRLLPRQRTALVMRELHGMSSAEIGEALGMKPGAVDTMVCRARDAFGRAFAGSRSLPDACRWAVEAVYRRTGTGLSPMETQRLDAHLESCASCRAEFERADDPRYLGMLLPWLMPGRPGLGRAIAHAARVLRELPASAASHAVEGSTVVVSVALAGAIALGPVIQGVPDREPGSSVPLVAIGRIEARQLTQVRDRAARRGSGADDGSAASALHAAGGTGAGHAGPASRAVAGTGDRGPGASGGAGPAESGSAGGPAQRASSGGAGSAGSSGTGSRGSGAPGDTAQGQGVAGSGSGDTGSGSGGSRSGGAGQGGGSGGQPAAGRTSGGS